MTRPTGRPKSVTNSTCETCGKPIVRYPSRMRRFCSSKCWGQSQVRLTPDFWARVERRSPDECWPFQGSINRSLGYGTIKFERVFDYAHRVAYRLTYGEIPEGQVVRHACDNRRCCNPRHLSLGTHGDNMDDMVEHNRHRRQASRESLLKEVEAAEDRLMRLKRALEKLEA